MLVFLDESGDAVMKVGNGSSRYFVVGLTLFESHEEASRCEDAIMKLRKMMSLPLDFEFHYASNSERQQRSFLETVTGFDFETHVFALNKARLTASDFQVKGSLYQLLARMSFESALDRLDNATVTIDATGDRAFKRQFTSYLRVLNLDGKRSIDKVKLQPAHQNQLLQLADYVASIWGGYLLGRAKAERHFTDYLKLHQRTFRSWP